MRTHPAEADLVIVASALKSVANRISAMDNPNGRGYARLNVGRTRGLPRID
jgi:hypothetical protein